MPRITQYDTEITAVSDFAIQVVGTSSAGKTGALERLLGPDRDKGPARTSSSANLRRRAWDLNDVAVLSLPMAKLFAALLALALTTTAGTPAPSPAPITDD